jgi:hypothetical protein
MINWEGFPNLRLKQRILSSNNLDLHSISLTEGADIGFDYSSSGNQKETLSTATRAESSARVGSPLRVIFGRKKRFATKHAFKVL